MIFALRPMDLVAWINMGAFGGLEIAFLLPLAGGLYWKRATSAGCLISIAAGFAVYGWALFMKPDLAGFHAIVPAFAAAAFFFVAGSLLTRDKENANLRYFFPQH